ncbi:MAG: hypothetical protein P4L46_18245 [Fimbriimonas sp.]|nr:hypothetical protein [Fimbriimonas sp.]
MEDIFHALSLLALVAFAVSLGIESLRAVANTRQRFITYRWLGIAIAILSATHAANLQRQSFLESSRWFYAGSIGASVVFTLIPVFARALQRKTTKP